MAGGKSTLTVRHPAGVQAAWTRMDPHSSLADPVVQDGVMTVGTAKGQKAPREVFVQLAQGAAASGLQVTWTQAGTTLEQRVRAGVKSGLLLTLGAPPAQMTVDLAWQPVPRGQGVQYAGEVTEEMRALGYIE